MGIYTCRVQGGQRRQESEGRRCEESEGLPATATATAGTPCT